MKGEQKVEMEDKYSMNEVEGVWELELHGRYRVTLENPLHADIPKLYKLYLEKEKRRNHKLHQLIPYSYFPSFELALRGDEHKDDKCSICQF